MGNNNFKLSKVLNTVSISNNVASNAVFFITVLH